MKNLCKADGNWLAPIPEDVKQIVVQDASKVEEVATQVDFIFCAVDMKKNEIKALEEAYAKTGTPVISNNSAHRWTPDIPMVIPEINPGHIEVIAAQRKRLGTSTGFIAVKPNCSIQSYVPALHALLDFKPTNVVASTYQAISGAGKNFTDWPDMLDNVIPYIGGEEEKSEQEPLRIWGSIENNEIVKASCAINYNAMYSRSSNGWTFGYCICIFREKTFERRNSMLVGCNSKDVRRSWVCQVRQNSSSLILKKRIDHKRNWIVILSAEWVFRQDDCARIHCMIINLSDYRITHYAEQQVVLF